MLKAGKKCIKKQKINKQILHTFFFHLLEQFAKLKKTNCMNPLILENTIQNLTTSTCGLFQLYFYKNLFDPDEKSKILNHQTLTKNTLQTRINEIFSTDIGKNEYLIKNYICFYFEKIIK